VASAASAALTVKDTNKRNIRVSEEPETAPHAKKPSLTTEHLIPIEA
jgi:hypothetical protein